MAQQLTGRENVQRKPTAAIIEPKIADWDSFLLNRLQKIAPNPQFYEVSATKEMSHKYIDLTGACKVCAQNHNPVTIQKEHVGSIITPASAVQELKKKNVRSNILSTDIFWPEEEGF